MNRLIVAGLILLVACSDDLAPTDGGAVDGALDGRVPDGDVPDGETLDTGVGADGSVSALPFCAEAEDLGLDGEVRSWPGQPSTMGAIAMLDPDDGGRVYFDFTLGAEEAVELWARVRAPTHSNNSLSVGLGELPAAPGDATIWHIPITPVLSWQRVLPRGELGREWRPDDEAWPGVLPAGSHRLVVAGREPAVELDAFCVMPTEARPLMRLAAPPERTDVISAADHGAIGDGSADDTAAIQAALDAATEGQVVRLPAGRYRTTSALTVRRSNITLEGSLDDAGQRQTTLFFDHPGGSAGGGATGGIVVVGPSSGTATDLLEDAAALDRTVVVDAAEPFAVGDRVVIDADPWGPLNEDLVNAGKSPAEFNRWRRSRGRVMQRTEDAGRATLVLDRPFLTPFAREHASRIALYHPLEGLVIRRLILEGTERHLDGTTDDEWTAEERARNSGIKFIRLRRVADAFVHDLEVFHFRTTALHLEDTEGVQVFDNHIHDSTDWDGGGHGYGVVATTSQGAVYHSNRFTGVMRHSIGFSNGMFDSSIVDNTVVRATEPHPFMVACIDLHGQDDHSNLITGNSTIGGSVGVILGGGRESHGNDGPWNVVRGNTFEGHGAGGVDVDDHTHSQVIEDNVILDCTNTGVRVNHGSDDTYIWNNRVNGWYRFGAGMRIDDAVGTQVIGNVIGGGETDVAVLIGGSSRDYLVTENEVGANTIDHPGTGTVE